MTPKPKTCKACRGKFTPTKPLQRVCSPACAIAELGAKKAKAAKVERVETAKALAKLKTRAQWLAECQAIVNKIARIRDAELGCVSCDRPSTWGGQWHASHLRSVGAASAVRFHLWNINKACSICNNHLSGNIGSYLPRLRDRIGDKKVDWLYQQNQLVRHDVNYLIRFKMVMSKKLKRMIGRKREQDLQNELCRSV